MPFLLTKTKETITMPFVPLLPPSSYVKTSKYHQDISKMRIHHIQSTLFLS